MRCQRFVSSDLELLQVSEELNDTFVYEVSENIAEYGDFQTNQSLADQVTKKLKKRGLSPKIVIELLL